MNTNDDHLVSVAQLKDFVKLENCAKFKSNSSKVDTYDWIEKCLGRFRYFSLKKKEKSIVKNYIAKMTRYSERGKRGKRCQEPFFSLNLERKVPDTFFLTFFHLFPLFHLFP